MLQLFFLIQFIDEISNPVNPQLKHYICLAILDHMSVWQPSFLTLNISRTFLNGHMGCDPNDFNLLPIKQF